MCSLQILPSPPIEMSAARTGRLARRRDTTLYARWGKRPLDVLFVLAVLPIIVPLVLILSLMILRGGGNVFYSQMRIGRRGRPFRLWKLCTMVPDADLRLTEYLAQNPEAKAEWDRTQKLKNDPRITPFGHFLRKSSLDELPQFFNVLTGDMSVVGPRPMMVEQAGMYPGNAYYQLRPGVTGPWQISDRNESSFAARAQFDTTYHDELSLRKDAAIIMRTVGAVLNCTGH